MRSDSIAVATRIKQRAIYCECIPFSNPVVCDWKAQRLHHQARIVSANPFACALQKLICYHSCLLSTPPSCRGVCTHAHVSTKQKPVHRLCSLARRDGAAMQCTGFDSCFVGHCVPVEAGTGWLFAVFGESSPFPALFYTRMALFSKRHCLPISPAARGPRRACRLVGRRYRDWPRPHAPLT